MGRGILMQANHAAPEELPAHVRHPLQLLRSRQVRIPLALPSFLLNRHTAALFNDVYYALHGALEEFADFERFFYPLDILGNWNLCYGRRGFIQYQSVFPMTAAREGLMALLRRIVESGTASLLAVLKAFGEGNPGLLSFPMKGFTLTLDIPVSPRLKTLVRELDQVVLNHGGRVYLAKDAMLDQATFRGMYPRLDEFREIRSRLDPSAKVMSSLARRIGTA